MKKRNQKLLVDLLNDVHVDVNCDHTPDARDFIDWELRDDKIVMLYACNCGKTVEEMFIHMDTRVIDR